MYGRREDVNESSSAPESNAVRMSRNSAAGEPHACLIFLFDCQANNFLIWFFDFKNKKNHRREHSHRRRDLFPAEAYRYLLAVSRQVIYLSGKRNKRAFFFCFVVSPPLVQTICTATTFHRPLTTLIAIAVTIHSPCCKLIFIRLTVGVMTSNPFKGMLLLLLSFILELVSIQVVKIRSNLIYLVAFLLD